MIKMYTHEQEGFRASLKGEILLENNLVVPVSATGMLNGSRVFLTSNKDSTKYYVESRFDTYLKTESKGKAKTYFDDIVSNGLYFT